LVCPDSPDWKSYIENNWLRIIRPYSIVLNWSERKLELLVGLFAVQHWGGKINPMAIILAGWFKIKVIWFLKYLKISHGKKNLYEPLKPSLSLLRRKKTKSNEFEIRQRELGRC
jgi:hypothetical protein